MGIEAMSTATGCSTRSTGRSAHHRTIPRRLTSRFERVSSAIGAALLGRHPPDSYSALHSVKLTPRRGARAQSRGLLGPGVRVLR